MKGETGGHNPAQELGAAQLRRVMSQVEQFKRIEPSIANDVMFTYIESELWSVVELLENGNGRGGNGNGNGKGGNGNGRR